MSVVHHENITLYEKYAFQYKECAFFVNFLEWYSMMNVMSILFNLKVKSVLEYEKNNGEYIH